MPIQESKLSSEREDPRLRVGLVSRRGWAILEWLLIVAVFFIFAGGRPPDVNEAHYLAKAKHYWSPQWCAGDTFLESADAHAIFYWSIGWLTKWLSLPATAWIGRILTWGSLAWAWRRLSNALLSTDGAAPRWGLAILSAALFATAMEWLPMAGEWILGGLEAKGFAYVFVLLALEALVRDRWSAAWVSVGIASSFHVLVGGWAGVACGLAWQFARYRPSLSSQAPAIAGGILLSLPGLIPAALLNFGAPREIADEANRIYVFERLPHHLVLHEFEWSFVARFAAGAVVWAIAAWVVRRQAPFARINAFVAGTLIIAAAGAVIELATLNRPDLSAGCLRFYFFRLSDIAVPMGATLSIVGIGVARFGAWTMPTRLIFASLLLGAALAGMSREFYLRMSDPRPAAERLLTANRTFTKVEAREKYEDWLRVCRWVKRNTPADSRFLTPQFQQSFKWRAERSEVVNWKDVPQDAASIVAWRRQFFAVYPRAVRLGGIMKHADRRLNEFAREYDAQYLIVDRSQGVRPTKLVRLYPLADEPEGYYEVYRLAPKRGGVSD